MNTPFLNTRYLNSFHLSISFLLALILWSSSLGTKFYSTDEEVSSGFLLGFFIIFCAFSLFSVPWMNIAVNESKVINKYGFRLFSLFIFFLIFQFFQSIIFGDSFKLFVSFRYIFFFSIIIVSVVIGIRVSDRALVFLEKIGIIWTLIFIILYTISFIKNPYVGLFREYRDDILFLNAIEDGGFFSVFFPFFLYSKISNIKKYIFITIFLFFLIIKNGTQASILAIFVILIIYLTYKRKRRKNTLIVIFILATSLFLITFFSNIFYTFDTGLSWRGVQQASNRQYSGSIGVRLGNIWIPMTLHVIENSPFIGFGNGSWRVQSQQLGFEYLHVDGTVSYVYQRSPHNVFLVYFVDWGIIGLSLMVYIFYKALKSNYQIMTNLKMNSQIKRYAEAYFCGWIGFLIWGFTGNAHGWLGWQVICFLLIGTVILNYHSLYAKPLKYLTWHP